MRSLDLFMPFIEPHVVGAADPLVRQMLVGTLIDFCEKTQVVERTLDFLDAVAGEAEYEFTATGQQEIVQLKRVWFRGVPLNPVAPPHVFAVGAFTAPTVLGDPRAGQKIGLYPTPDKTEVGVLVARASIKPRRSATAVEDVLFDDWVDAIAAGTLARLHDTPAQPYTDPVRAKGKQVEYLQAVSEARVQARKSEVAGSLQVRLREF
jgi:hypothetical protein